MQLFPDPPAQALPLSTAAQSCVLMLDLVGSTALAQQLPLSTWSALLNQWSLQIVELLEGYGGWLLPLQGDAALACWPADQAGAALEAAQQAHQLTGALPLAGALDLSLTLRAGLAAGELALLPWREPQPCGLPLHLAQRLCSNALPGETLLCPEMAQLLESRPGQGFSRLQPRALPPLRGFELLQSSGAVFYRAVPSNLHPGSDEMKAG